jgi:hypothetical protein
MVVDREGIDQRSRGKITKSRSPIGGLLFVELRTGLKPNDKRSLGELTDGASGSAHNPRKRGDGGDEK